MFAGLVDHRVASRRVDDPEVVAASPTKCAAYVARVAAQASAQFDAYVEKLSAKVGDSPGVAAATLDSVAIWNHSHLTVTRVDGSVDVWRTQAIFNVSCLGKVFNQWPTRRIDR